jgi:hypothetical protein
MHGDESATFGDSGSQGFERRQVNQIRSEKWHVTLCHGKRRALPDRKAGRLREQLEKHKASVQAKAEHQFHVLRSISGRRRTLYRGLTKSIASMRPLLALSNL